MRASLVAILALSGFSMALPGTDKRSLVTDVGSVVGKIGDGAGVTEVSDMLDGLLGGMNNKLEDVLGINFAEYLLGLDKRGAPPGTIQAIGEAVALLADGLGVTEVDAYLDKQTGGAITSIENALGVTDIEKALGLA